MFEVRSGPSDGQGPWHDSVTGKTKRLERMVHLLDAARFSDENEANGQLSLLAPAKHSFVRFGSLLFERYVNGYHVGVDNDFRRALARDRQWLARRVYSYLTKKDQFGATYREDMFLFARKMGLERTKRSDIEAALNAALTVLRDGVDVTKDKVTSRRRFVEAWKYTFKAEELGLDGKPKNAKAKPTILEVTFCSD